MLNSNDLFKQAEQFINTCYSELEIESQIPARLSQIKKEIDKDGHYEHLYKELSYGAKMAWRNSNRCIGRLFWNSLHVIDARKAENEKEIKNALFHHIDYATNKGKIIPTITIFKPKKHGKQPVRIWNHQLLRYAGYRKEDGSTIGDPASETFTKICLDLGWKGDGSQFDLLPLVFQINNREPVYFDIPEHIPLEVSIDHPEFDFFKQLNLKWYAVPILSDMKLEIGGIHYSAAPFNGWYMETEIGARNFADTNRYNLLPLVAEKLGLDTTRNATLWKDKALVELNIAILYSYKKAGVSIVDHHTAAEQFKLFEAQESKNGRELTGDWTWLIPPVSPATTHIFHRPYKDKMIKPNYLSQNCPYDHS